MPFFKRPSDPLAGTDPLLHAFLNARTDAEASRDEERLLDQHIRPVCYGILKPKFFGTGGQTTDAQTEDDYEYVCSRADEYVHGKLHRLRQEFQTSRSLSTPLHDLRAYAATTTFHAWHEYLRKRYPEFFRIKDALCRLLPLYTEPEAGTGCQSSEPEGGDAGTLTSWREPRPNTTSHRVAGYEAWRAQKVKSRYSERFSKLSECPQVVLAHILTCPCDDGKPEARTPLSREGLTRIFDWLEHPIALNALVKVFLALMGTLGTASVSLEPDSIADLGERIDTRADVLGILQMFWQCVCKKPTRNEPALTRNERVVILLGGQDPVGNSLLVALEVWGMAAERECAAIMELQPEMLAELWDDLPLYDSKIAEVLGCTVQSVRDRRIDARRKLGKCMPDLQCG